MELASEFLWTCQGTISTISEFQFPRHSRTTPDSSGWIWSHGTIVASDLRRFVVVGEKFAGADSWVFVFLEVRACLQSGNPHSHFLGRVGACSSAGRCSSY